MRHSLRKKQFRFESLESRAMLAITTTFIDGWLRAHGDGVHDNIVITGDIATGRITITGVSDSDGNPTLINGVENDSISFSPVYSQANFYNDAGGGTDNSVTIDDVYLTGMVSVNWRGLNTRVIVAGNAPVYSKDAILISAEAEETATVEATSSTVYSLGTVSLGAAGRQLSTLVSSTVQGNRDVRFGFEESDSATANITNVWAGEDLTVYAGAKNLNINLSQSSAVGNVTLSNLEGVESNWNVAFVFATKEFSLSADGIHKQLPSDPMGFPVFQPGTGTTNVHVQFCAAQTMKISGNGLLNSTTLYSNSVTGPDGVTVTHIATPDAQDGSTIELNYNVISGKLDIGMSSADDTLTLTGNTVNGATTLSGGTGTNILKRLYNVFGSPPTITDFTEN